jgi:hypothetical protein
MSALYLIDRHGSPAASASILDVQESTQPLLSGRFVVKVPDGVPITGNPTVLGDLSTPGTLLYEKAAGYLLFYAGFTRVTMDDLTDTTSVDLTSTGSQGGNFGQRSSIVLEPGGVFKSTTVNLTAPAPSQAFVTWDTFDYLESDSASALYARQYNELPSIPANVTCEVSFDGTTFLSTTDSAILNIPIPQQGTLFIIQLTNTSTSRLSIGSWSVIY